MHMLTRRAALAGLGAATATPLLAQVTTSPIPRPRPSERAKINMDQAAEALITRAGLGGQVCFALADATRGQILAMRGAARPMAPASTAKALTTAYALDMLGPAYRYRTTVLATGPLRQGRLEGDLVLVGGGDPTLDSDGLAALLDQLSAIGLREVTGRFLVWDRALPYVGEIDPGQPDHLGYNPSVSGLNLNFNRVHFQWQKRGGDYALSMDARTNARVPPVQIVSMRAANRDMPVYTYASDAVSGREDWTVARTALGGGGSRWLPVRGPGRYTAEVFQTLAKGSPMRLSLPEPQFPTILPDGVPIARHLSAPLYDIARDMLRYSTNLTAEVLGMSATAARVGEIPAGLTNSAMEMTLWAQRLGMHGTAMVDHSGLGPASRVTAQDMVTALVRLGPDGPLWPVLKRIGLQTKSGTPEAFELRAKTGTLNFVSCLTGYVRRPHAGPLAFAVLTAEPERRAAIAPGDEERPAGAISWSRASRALQYDLVRLWAGNA